LFQRREWKSKMPIDLSRLNPEKRAFLKAYPDLLKSLEQSISQQVHRVQTRKQRMEKGKPKWQREVEEAVKKAEELRRKYNPYLMEIERKLLRKAVTVLGLVCPVCGEGDRGNRKNGKPWCLKCDVPLVAKDKVEKWRRLLKVKVLHKDLRDELRRLNPGLYPEGDEK